MKWFKGSYYLRPRMGFSINEGGFPINLHVSWSKWKFFFYLFICPVQFHFTIQCRKGARS